MFPPPLDPTQEPLFVQILQSIVPGGCLHPLTTRLPPLQFGPGHLGMFEEGGEGLPLTRIEGAYQDRARRRSAIEREELGVGGLCDESDLVADRLPRPLDDRVQVVPLVRRPP